MTALKPDALRIHVVRTAEKTGLSEHLVEKDYWVVWLLDLLFSGPYGDQLTFKGGTSLSKAYKIIDRFSEDVDMTIDRSLIHLDPEKSLEAPDLGTAQRTKRGKAFNNSVGDFLKDEFAPWLDAEIKKKLSDRAGDTAPALRFDEKNPENLFFDYPRKPDATNNSYNPPFVRLELGARGDRAPQAQYAIRSYIEEEYPQLFKDKVPASINVLAIERTFWEKLTILHAVCCRPHDKLPPGRYSRHYYDVYHLAQDADLVARTLADTDLLAAVVKNSRAYFYDSSDWYSTAKRGSFRLIPSAEQQKSLIGDYAEMQDMIFGDTPDFSEIITALKQLEEKINTA